MQQVEIAARGANVTGTQPKPKMKKSPDQAGERAAKPGGRPETGKVSQKGRKRQPLEQQKSLGTHKLDYA